MSAGRPADATAAPSGPALSPASCLSWCGPDAMQDFWELLPTAITPNSPWSRYLAAAYGTPAVALAGFDMSSVGLLLLPASPHSTTGVPFDTKCPLSTSAVPNCSDDGWLLKRSRVKNVVNLKSWMLDCYHRSRQAAPWPWPNAQAKRAGREWVRIQCLQDGSTAQFFRLHNRLERRDVVGLIRGPSLATPRTPFASHQWVEVLRFQDRREGGNGSSAVKTREGAHASISGCWFYPLMAPYSRGSGVFINTGRTLVFDTRALARKALARPGATDDQGWALEARARGYDSIQLLTGPFGPPEMVVTRPGCLRGVSVPGACPPAEIELRRGRRAKLSCTCSDTVSEMLNCGHAHTLWWDDGPLPRVPQRLGAKGLRGGSRAVDPPAVAGASAMGGCRRPRRRFDGIDVVVARHRESIRWLDDFARSNPRVCVWLCNAIDRVVAAPSARGVAARLANESAGDAPHAASAGQWQYAVRNTGREAQCYVRHLLRMAREHTRLAGVTIFMQARPHCRSPSVSGPVCVEEVLSQLGDLTPTSLDARGGFVSLGSLPTDLPYNEAAFLDKACAAAELTSLTRDGEGSPLLRALRTHARFQIGAQFAVSRAALLSLFASPALFGWVTRTAAAFDAPSALASSAPGYTMAACCDAPGRSCLPWLWERTWQPLFHLQRLVSEESSAAAAQMQWTASDLAVLLERRTDRWRQLTARSDMFGAARRAVATQGQWVLEELSQLRAATGPAALDVLRPAQVAALHEALAKPICTGGGRAEGLCPRIGAAGDGVGRTSLRHLRAVTRTREAATGQQEQQGERRQQKLTWAAPPRVVRLRRALDALHDAAGAALSDVSKLERLDNAGLTRFETVLRERGAILSRWESIQAVLLSSQKVASRGRAR